MTSESDIKIRQLKIWEVPKLLKFRALYDYKSISDRARLPESIIYSLLKVIWHRRRLKTFVAVRGSEIVGYISLVFGRSREFKGNAYLISTAVKESERGKGIGTRLFDNIEKYGRSVGARRIEFDVYGKNTKALELYKRLGYEIEGVKRRAVERGGQYDDLIFVAKFIDNK